MPLQCREKYNHRIAQLPSRHQQIAVSADLSRGRGVWCFSIHPPQQNLQQRSLLGSTEGKVLFRILGVGLEPSQRLEDFDLAMTSPTVNKIDQVHVHLKHEDLDGNYHQRLVILAEGKSTPQ